MKADNNVISMKNPQIILSWKAPLRPYKKRLGSILRFYLAVALLFSLIVFFIGDKILLIPTWAILFLFYILTVTPPPIINNAVTSFGVETGGITIKWEFFSYFYLSSRFGYKMLTLVGHPPYNAHVYLVLPNDEKENNLINIFAEKVVYRQKPADGFVEKTTNFFLSLVPNDNEKEDLDEKKEFLPTPPLSRKGDPNEQPLHRR